MITLKKQGVYLHGGVPVDGFAGALPPEEAREGTIAASILRAHSKSKDPKRLEIRFDALISHDITYVGIIQTARASGLTEFPIPYALTNCHNSLCAVGGTINADDHAFGLSAAKKYGGIYVPANLAVIHQYARESLAACGKMILGSDSHTRYGCFGCMGVGEGGGELAKQLLKNTWDAPMPKVVLVWLKGKVPHGVGPHDIAVAICGAVFKNGFVKNAVLEFAGPGIADMDMDFRAGIDVMSTEAGCLTSVWETDDTVKAYYADHGRPDAYKKLQAKDGAWYDAMVEVDLDKLQSMIALPFHPSNAFTLKELMAHPREIFEETQAACNEALGGKVSLRLTDSIGRDGLVRASQGVIVGCAGGMYRNILEAAAILEGRSTGNGIFELDVYPSSAPVGLSLLRDGVTQKLAEAGAVVKPAFCGPCFGAGDTPANNTLSIRHATRNFANREGSKPQNGQIAGVALMDARSIAATAANGGILIPATEVEYTVPAMYEKYDGGIYEKRVWNGWGNADKEAELVFGPNIKDWPKMPKLEENLLVRLTAVIRDPVTTTDELIPSGETSSYRSNPEALSEFALSRRAPAFVGKSKAVRAVEQARQQGEVPAEVQEILAKAGTEAENTSIGGCLYATKPGDGSAREQAASCQKVLGGFANICVEYATKRYRSNCINWGLVPFTCEGEFPYEEDAWVYIPGIRSGILAGKEQYEAQVFSGGMAKNVTLECKGLTAEERLILTEGCLMNYYAAGHGSKEV